jgi:hypothetical protein
VAEEDGVQNEDKNPDPVDYGAREPAEDRPDDGSIDASGSESENIAIEQNGDAAADQDGGGIVDELTWLGRGFFQPLYDERFYRAAAQKSLIDSILFFVVFGTLLTIISTINLSRNLGSAADDIEQAFASGEFPEIVIENGFATVRARQPLILLEREETIIILDTSGAYQSIDTSRYSQGFLLTRNSLHVYSNGDYQVVQLSDFNSAFSNPIVINRETALDLWRSFTSIFALVAFIGIGLWNLVARFIWLTFLAGLVWWVLSAFNIRSEYGPVLTVGI